MKNIGHTIHYLKMFWKDRNIASITPSSSFAVKKICSKIDFSKDNVIVECGPGNGVFSFAILRRMSPNSRLILIEANKEFAQYLEQHIDDPRVYVFHDDAVHIPLIVSKSGIHAAADYVILGIPFSFSDHELNHKIIANSKEILKKEGTLLVYQFSLRIKKYLKHYFDRITTCLEILNIPPLIIFEASHEEIYL